MRTRHIGKDQRVKGIPQNSSIGAQDNTFINITTAIEEPLYLANLQYGRRMEFLNRALVI